MYIRAVPRQRETAGDLATRPGADTAGGEAVGGRRRWRWPDFGGRSDRTPASGIGLYPPVGTRPPRSGVIVPEDFDLPAGFLRHVQTTDDGRELPAILMFHPDYDFEDAAGRPIAIPASRIVPPEMAPPALPIRILEIPEAVIPGPPPGTGTRSSGRP